MNYLLQAVGGKIDHREGGCFPSSLLIVQCTRMYLYPSLPLVFPTETQSPQVSSAADLIRTASHDRSSHSVSYTRGLRLANVPAAYSDVERTAYYRSSDRIGRLYTPTAAALTSTSAHIVAKAAATLAVASGAPAGSGGGGGNGVSDVGNRRSRGGGERVYSDIQNYPIDSG